MHMKDDSRHVKQIETGCMEKWQEENQIDRKTIIHPI